MYNHHAAFISVNAADYDFLGDRLVPEEMIDFLDTILPNDVQAIECIREILGCILMGDTSFHKIFGFIGPPRSGKGTIGNIISELVGEQNVAAPTLSTLGGDFGLQSWIGKKVANFTDGRIDRINGTVTERLLRISGGDIIDINRKQKGFWVGRLNTPIVLMSNILPKLGDASGAIASRFLLISIKESFLGREDHKLFERLNAEMPIIATWAIDGYYNLKRRGHFLQPKSGVTSMEELNDIVSPMSAFIRDKCVVDKELHVEKDKLFREFKHWAEDNGHTYPKSTAVFTSELKAVLPKLERYQPKINGRRENHYRGIGLQDSRGKYAQMLSDRPVHDLCTGRKFGG